MLIMSGSRIYHRFYLRLGLPEGPELLLQRFHHLRDEDFVKNPRLTHTTASYTPLPNHDIKDDLASLYRPNYGRQLHSFHTLPCAHTLAASCL